MSKRIHIVSFDVPFPADYGGVIDVFTRVKWFSENGWDVKLHCFEYKRPRANELEKYAEVHYFDRPRGLKHWFSKIPFIVKTRIHPDLESILKNTTDEVLLEGLHCAHYLNLQPNKFYLRTHNIEHDYYHGLAKKATSVKKRYYNSEAKKLKNFEPILAKAKALLVIAKNELDHFQTINSNSYYVPPIFKVENKFQGTEPFVLMQGNLSVEENDEAAHWILKNIVPNSNAKVVIAGKNPTQSLKDKCSSSNVVLIANPSSEEMRNLLVSARIHLLWTTNSSGLKLKLINALASSGHVICNSAIVEGSGLTNGFHITEEPQKVNTLIESLIKSELDIEEWNKRIAGLKKDFNGNQLEAIFK